MLPEDPGTVSQTINFMSPLAIYLIGLIITFIAFTAINYHTRWLRKDDLDGEGMGVVLFMAVVLWPIAIVVGIVIGLFTLYKSVFIPD